MYLPIKIINITRIWLVVFLAINASAVFALGSISVDHANTGGAFTASASWSGTGCGDTVGIRTDGNCQEVGWWETHTGGCGGVSISKTLHVGTGVTGCRVRFGGKASCYGCEPSWGSDVYVRVNQLVTISGAPASSLTGDTVNLSATVATQTFGTDTSSYNAITWSASGNCSVDGSGNVTNGFLTSSCTVTASVAGTTNNLYPASSQVSWTVAKRSQSLSVTNDLTSTMPALSQDTVAGSAAGGVTITTSGGCSGGGSNSATITATDATAQCQVTYTAAENNYYYAAPESPIVQNATVTKLDQTITFGAQSSQDYSPSGTFALNPAASASSGYVIDYSSGTPSVCSVSIVGVVSILSAGTCTIHADQPGDTPIYNAATRVSQNIVINKVSQNITVTTAAPANSQIGNTFPVAASSNSGLPVAITASGGCSVPGGSTDSATVTVNSSADCIVYYNQTGNSNYNAATQVSSTTIITLPLQTMVITTPAPAQAYVGDVFTVNAISYIKDTVTPSGQNIAITIAPAPNNGCQINSGGSNTAEIELVSGTTPCKILYNQSGTGGYEPVAEQSNTTTAIRISQLISVTTPAPTSAIQGQVFVVEASSPSADGVTIEASGGCSGSGTNSASITMNSSTSSCTVTYTQSGDDDYYPAANITSVTREGTAPVITEVTPVPSTTGSNPEYTFSSDEAGSILYGGACTSSTDAGVGITTIVFDELAGGEYSDCTIRVRDAAGNLSNSLSLGTFTVVPDLAVYVKTTASGAGDCSSWANACDDIQQAIDIVAANEVRIAQGIYRPSSTLILKSGVSIYGGFAGTEATRVATGDLTIISGDTSANDTTNEDGLVLYRADVNTSGSTLSRIFSATNLTTAVEKQVLISGLSLNAAGSANGSGLQVYNSRVKVNNVQFVALAGNSGGAVSVEAGGYFTAVDSTFLRNESSGVGGAIAVSSNTGNVVDIQRSLFDSNTGGTYGGAIHHPAGQLSVINSTFYGNSLASSSGSGGAINFASIDNPSNASIKYATFVGNIAGTAGSPNGRGGAISIDASGVTAVVVLSSSLVLDNAGATGANIAGMNNMTDGGYNIVGFNGISGVVEGAGNTLYNFVGTSTTATNITVDEIIETTLANNGGLTANLKLQPDSYAADRIPNQHSDCVSSNSVGTDQRALSRPSQDGENCDVGAVETQPVQSCSSPNREEGYSMGFYPGSNTVCLGGASLLSGGVVHPFYLIMLAIIGLLGVNRQRYDK